MGFTPFSGHRAAAAPFLACAQAMADPSGQVATQTGHASLQGFTAVFGLFSVPAALAKPSTHLPSTLDSTPEGLAAYLAARPKAPPQPSTTAPGHVPEPQATGGGVPDDDAIDGMGIKAMRSLVVSAGLSHRDCIEKPDLRKRAKEASEKLRGMAS